MPLFGFFMLCYDFSLCYYCLCCSNCFFSPFINCLLFLSSTDITYSDDGSHSNTSMMPIISDGKRRRRVHQTIPDHNYSKEKHTSESELSSHGSDLHNSSQDSMYIGDLSADCKPATLGERSASNVSARPVGQSPDHTVMAQSSDSKSEPQSSEQRKESNSVGHKLDALSSDHKMKDVNSDYQIECHSSNYEIKTESLDQKEEAESSNLNMELENSDHKIETESCDHKMEAETSDHEIEVNSSDQKMEDEITDYKIGQSSDHKMEDEIADYKIGQSSDTKMETKISGDTMEDHSSDQRMAVQSCDFKIKADVADTGIKSSGHEVLSSSDQYKALPFADSDGRSSMLYQMDVEPPSDCVSSESVIRGEPDSVMVCTQSVGTSDSEHDESIFDIQDVDLDTIQPSAEHDHDVSFGVESPSERQSVSTVSSSMMSPSQYNIDTPLVSTSSGMFDDRAKTVANLIASPQNYLSDNQEQVSHDLSAPVLVSQDSNIEDVTSCESSDDDSLDLESASHADIYIDDVSNEYRVPVDCTSERTEPRPSDHGVQPVVTDKNEMVHSPDLSRKPVFSTHSIMAQSRDCSLQEKCTDYNRQAMSLDHKGGDECLADKTECTLPNEEVKLEISDHSNQSIVGGYSRKPATSDHQIKTSPDHKMLPSENDKSLKLASSNVKSCEIGECVSTESGIAGEPDSAAVMCTLSKETSGAEYDHSMVVNQEFGQDIIQPSGDQEPNVSSRLESPSDRQSVSTVSSSMFSPSQHNIDTPLVSTSGKQFLDYDDYAKNIINIQHDLYGHDESPPTLVSCDSHIENLSHRHSSDEGSIDLEPPVLDEAFSGPVFTENNESNMAELQQGCVSMRDYQEEVRDDQSDQDDEMMADIKDVSILYVDGAGDEKPRAQLTTPAVPPDSCSSAVTFTSSAPVSSSLSCSESGPTHLSSESNFGLPLLCSGAVSGSNVNVVTSGACLEIARSPAVTSSAVDTMGSSAITGSIIESFSPTAITGSCTDDVIEDTNSAVVTHRHTDIPYSTTPNSYDMDVTSSTAVSVVSLSSTPVVHMDMDTSGSAAVSNSNVDASAITALNKTDVDSTITTAVANVDADMSVSTAVTVSGFVSARKTAAIVSDSMVVSSPTVSVIPAPVTDTDVISYSNQIVCDVSKDKEDRLVHLPQDKDDDNMSNKALDKVSDKPPNEASHEVSDKCSDKTSGKTVDKLADKSPEKSWDRPSDKQLDKPSDKPSDEPLAKPSDKSSDKPLAIPSAKPSDRALVTPSDKPAEKASDKPAVDDVTRDRHIQYKDLIGSCISALCLCLQRLPQHHKSLYRLAYIYMYCPHLKVIMFFLKIILTVLYSMFPPYTKKTLVKL